MYSSNLHCDNVNHRFVSCMKLTQNLFMNNRRFVITELISIQNYIIDIKLILTYNKSLNIFYYTQHITLSYLCITTINFLTKRQIKYQILLCVLISYFTLQMPFFVNSNLDIVEYP